MTRLEREAQPQKTTCYIATHRDSGRQYVGMTKRTLKARRSQHERDAANSRSNSALHNAIREYGNDAFEWHVVAEGEHDVIALLEHALIERLGTNRLGGFNARGGYELPPVRDEQYELFAEEMDVRVGILDMLNDLEAIVRYVEEHYSGTSNLEDLAQLARRLVNRVDELDKI